MFIRWTYEWQEKEISVTKRRFAFTNQTVLCRPEGNDGDVYEISFC